MGICLQDGQHLAGTHSGVGHDEPVPAELVAGIVVLPDPLNLVLGQGGARAGTDRRQIQQLGVILIGILVLEGQRVHLAQQGLDIPLGVVPALSGVHDRLQVRIAQVPDLGVLQRLQRGPRGAVVAGLVLAQLGQSLRTDHLPQLLQGSILGELLPVQHHFAHLWQRLQRVTFVLEAAADLVVTHAVLIDVDLGTPLAGIAVLVDAPLPVRPGTGLPRGHQLCAAPAAPCCTVRQFFAAFRAFKHCFHLQKGTL